jgi:SAM-dependent methyltransferase
MRPMDSPGSRRIGTTVGPDYDPGDGGTSLATVKELVIGLLDVVAASSVVEIGAFRGQFTAELLAHGTRVIAVDPQPAPELAALAEAHPELELVRATSLDALPSLAPADVVVVDGDHNYYTVREELRLIRAAGAPGPLLILHDVGWPLGRRDAYHAPDRVPEELRQPLSPSNGLSATPDFGRDQPFAHVAAVEGGPRNGVLTAVEDYVAGDPMLRLAVVPAFFGVGVVWDERAAWADAVATAVAPWDRSPLVERLEAHRVAHLLGEARQGRKIADLEQRLERQERVLRRLLASRAFCAVERLSRLRRSGRPGVSRSEVEDALG